MGRGEQKSNVKTQHFHSRTFCSTWINRSTIQSLHNEGAVLSVACTPVPVWQTPGRNHHATSLLLLTAPPSSAFLLHVHNTPIRHSRPLKPLHHMRKHLQTVLRHTACTCSLSFITSHQRLPAKATPPHKRVLRITVPGPCVRQTTRRTQPQQPTRHLAPNTHDPTVPGRCRKPSGSCYPATSFRTRTNPADHSLTLGATPACTSLTRTLP